MKLQGFLWSSLLESERELHMCHMVEHSVHVLHWLDLLMRQYHGSVASTK